MPNCTIAGVSTCSITLANPLKSPAIFVITARQALRRERTRLKGCIHSTAGLLIKHGEKDRSCVTKTIRSLSFLTRLATRAFLSISLVKNSSLYQCDWWEITSITLQVISPRGYPVLQASTILTCTAIAFFQKCMNCYYLCAGRYPHSRGINKG